MKDAVGLTAAAIIGVLLLVAAWEKLWGLTPNSTYLAGALLAAPIGATSIMRMRRHRSWTRQYGILSEDALRPDRWIPYEASGHLLILICALLPLVVITAHLSGRPLLATLAAATALFAAAGSVASAGFNTVGPRPNPPMILPASATSLDGHHVGGRRIALSRRLVPLPIRCRNWGTLLTTGIAVGLFPTLGSAAGGGGQALLACASAFFIIPLLWLTRQDGDLIAAQALAGMRPLASARDALAPAGAYVLAVTSGLLVSAAVGTVPYTLPGLAAASGGALSIVYVLRAWRMPRLSRRAADTLACVDLAVVMLAAIALSWAALPVLIILTWRLHRQANASVLSS